jgi:hypothetical protein
MGKREREGKKRKKEKERKKEEVTKIESDRDVKNANISNVTSATVASLSLNQ